LSVVTKDSEEHTASIFYTEDEGSMLLESDGNQAKDYMVSTQKTTS
jgi:hypothetical protein